MPEQKQCRSGGTGKHQQYDQRYWNGRLLRRLLNRLKCRNGWYWRFWFVCLAGGQDEFRVARAGRLRHQDFSEASGTGYLRPSVFGISRNMLAADWAGKFELAHGSDFGP